MIMRDKNMKNIIITYCDMCSQRIVKNGVYEITKMPFSVRGAKNGSKGLICRKCFQDVEEVIGKRR